MTGKTKTDLPKLPPVVLIIWKDACTSQGWTNEIHPGDCISTCTSIGRIVAEDNEQIILAGTWSDDHHNQRIAIPNKWIVLRRKVEIGKSK